MKAESNIMPIAAFEIEFSGEMCEIRFFENINKIANEEGESKYSYDEYLLRIRNRINIQADIERDYGAWLRIAKDTEYEMLISKLRNDRNKLLEETDKYMLPDYPITPDSKKEIMLYRQSLRDITKLKECPYDIDLCANKTNICKVDSAVAPSSFTVVAPVDRVSEMRTELDEIKAIINTPKNMTLQANYAEDEYNKSIKELEGMM